MSSHAESSELAHSHEGEQPGACIKVISVGGGGNNAINRMIDLGLDGVEFISVNTDVQSLRSSKAHVRLQLGAHLTNGLGTGANPELGRQAALEESQKLGEALEGADMVFITAGMGGGTGTGMAPVVAMAANKIGALTVAVVTLPFAFEGRRRMERAEQGLQDLLDYVDTLIVVPNERLLGSGKDMGFFESFQLADDVLRQAVQGISDIITVPGVINRDFADIRTTMAGMGYGVMGTATRSGPDRAGQAARAAIESPLLVAGAIEGARAILINIAGSHTLKLNEVYEASTIIQRAAHEEANIIFGAVLDERLGDEIKITVIATGFHQDSRDRSRRRALTQTDVERPIARSRKQPLPQVLPPVLPQIETQILPQIETQIETQVESQVESPGPPHTETQIEPPVERQIQDAAEALTTPIESATPHLERQQPESVPEVAVDVVQEAREILTEFPHPQSERQEASPISPIEPESCAPEELSLSTIDTDPEHLGEPQTGVEEDLYDEDLLTFLEGLPFDANSIADKETPSSATEVLVQTEISRARQAAMAAYTSMSTRELENTDTDTTSNEDPSFAAILNTRQGIHELDDTESDLDFDYDEELPDPEEAVTKSIVPQIAESEKNDLAIEPEVRRSESPTADATVELLSDPEVTDDPLKKSILTPGLAGELPVADTLNTPSMSTKSGTRDFNRRLNREPDFSTGVEVVSET